MITWSCSVNVNSLHLMISVKLFQICCQLKQKLDVARPDADELY